MIHGSIDLLRRPNLADDKRARYIDAIGDTADRAAKLTGQLLAFARRQALKPELFDLGTCIDNVADMIRTLLGSRTKLETHFPDQLVHVMADRVQFESAIVNLAVNARDAMDGEGKLVIGAGPVSGIPAVRSHPPVAGDFIAVTVTDTGTGIEPDQLGRIYEPFFTTKPVGEGTGLGLSQVIGFAKQSGGDIDVKGTVGKGTTFTLYLPRAGADGDEASDEATSNSPVNGEGYCVLVVEDNAQVGEFATQALGAGLRQHSRDRRRPGARRVGAELRPKSRRVLRRGNAGSERHRSRRRDPAPSPQHAGGPDQRLQPRPRAERQARFRAAT